jgi:hypothetical protein
MADGGRDGFGRPRGSLLRRLNISTGLRNPLP